MVNVNDLAITSLETITAFDLHSGAWLFTLDELQNASIAHGQEKNDIVGKQGRKVSSLKRNKTVTVSGDNGVVSGGLLEMQVGDKFVSEATEVQWIDYLTVASNKATTTYKAIGTVGVEIEAVYVKNPDGTVGTVLEQATAAATGKFAYAPSTKELSFTGIADGTEIVVYYKRKISASTLANKSDVFSGKCALYIDFLAEDKCANVYRGQFYIPKADFNGEFTFEMGDNQTIHSFEAEGLAGACGASGQLWSLTIFGANTADAT